MSYKKDFSIVSGPVPSVSLSVKPGETVMAGKRMFLSGDPSLEQKTELFKSKDRLGLLKFIVSGESLFINKYTNMSKKDAAISFSDESVGSIVEISDELGEGVLCSRGAFMAATNLIEIGFKQVRSFSVASLTSQPMWMQFCQNSNPEDNSTVFLMSGAMPTKHKLEAGQMLCVDNKAIFAMTKGIGLRAYENESYKSAYFSGEGRFLTVAQGPGTVWIAPEKQELKGNALVQKIRSFLPV